MAKTEYTLARMQDEPAIITFADGATWNLPDLLSLITLPADAIGNGKLGSSQGAMETLNVARTFKMVDHQDHEGGPMIVTVTVAVETVVSPALFLTVNRTTYVP